MMLKKKSKKNYFDIFSIKKILLKIHHAQH
jgi:hypothetical protein